MSKEKKKKNDLCRLKKGRKHVVNHTYQEELQIRGTETFYFKGMQIPTLHEYKPSHKR
jgi:hypothetical protein